MNVGESMRRVDGHEKVTGATRYVADLKVKGMLFGATVRAPVACGVLKRLTFSRNFDWTAVTTVTPADIPGLNAIHVIQDDMPCLAARDIKYLGEPLALVCAGTAETAKAAAANVMVEVEKKEPLLGIEEIVRRYKAAHHSSNYGPHGSAVEDGSARRRAEVPVSGSRPPHSVPEPLVFFYEPSIVKGDVEAAFKNSDLMVESEYRTGFQEHAYLETQGVIAIPHRDGSVRIIGSLQCPYYVRPAVARVLGMPDEKVVVEQAPTGGAFGGKEDFPSLLAAHAALLAVKSGRPVRIVYDRQEDISFTTKRHPSWIRHKAGVRRDGRIVALESEILFDAGAYATLSSVVLARGLLHACGVYSIPNVRQTAKAVKSNAPPSGAFRGFGVPQTIFAVESHVDTIARRLGMSPLDVRKQNILRPGDAMATGQVLTESVGASACLEAVAAACGCGRSPAARAGSTALAVRPAVKPLVTDAGKRRGIGLSCSLHGATFTGSGELVLKSRAALKLMPSGEVEILTATTEMGQGLQTVLIQLAAQFLGIGTARVKCRLPDTSVVPNSGPTVASRSTMVVGRILELCSAELLRRMHATIAGLPGPTPSTKGGEGGSGLSRKGEGFLPPGSRKPISWKEASRLVCGRRPLVIEKQYDLPPGLDWDDATFTGAAYPAYSWGATAVEVEVDMATCEVSPLRLWLAYEIGKALNPLGVQGQLEGGSIQALGYGLLESMELKEGRFLQNRLQTYVIPTAADVPEIRLQVLEIPYSRGPCGAKGIGELPHDGVAPALRNAVLNALDVEINSLPLTPEKIFERPSRRPAMLGGAETESEPIPRRRVEETT
ncbi:MAG: xanthine dehydrogenase family protein molybdopterin-binding subunit [Planctomycetota bacterium]|nr:xanthine dehydrogenase family protein molybdopterin-binding subunit [Planctomycetota bacterium]